MPGPRPAAEGSDTPTATKEEPSNASRAPPALRQAYVRAIARLPRPARLLWILLAVLGAYAVVFNLGGLGLVPLLVLPAVAAETDFLFQMFRYRSVRAPDAAIATGALMALLLPPTVSLIQAGAVTVAAIILRHVVRYRERPLVNPAVLGVLLGALFFGMAPSWWGAINVWLVVGLGIVLTLRTPGSWRIPASFFLSYGALSVVASVLFSGTRSPQVLFLSAVDPAMLFFGFYMVPEPRTSPSDPVDRWLFGLAVGLASAFLPQLLPSLAPLVALILGNALALASRGIEAAAIEAKRARRKASRSAKRKRRAPSRAPSEMLDSWTAGRRIAAGALVFVAIGAMAFAARAPTATPFAAVRPSLPASAPAAVSTSSCAQDNPSIPSDQLSFYHQRLGPSRILSVDQNGGTVVFYDPVNNATITETDMYEDYGFAEFNGDDYAVMGCAP